MKPLNARLCCLILAAGCLCAALVRPSCAAGFASATAASPADAVPLVVENLTTADGLPQGSVMATLQDSQGFVWLGTQDGLVRYDGHELIRYAYSRDAHSALPGNFIYQIVEDSRHDLWIAVKDGGIARWNRASDTFTLYRHDARNPGSLASDTVRTILIDEKGRVWIGMSDAGIDILDPASGHIEHLRHRAGEPASLVSDRVQTLAPGRAGNIWIGTEAGLDEWDAARGALVHFPQLTAAGHSLGRGISRVLEDASGAVWIGIFDGGLDRLDRDGTIVQVFRHDPRDATTLASDDVRALLEDRAGRLWVGTSAGLDLLERSSGTFHHYRHDPSDADSLSDSFIMSLYQDDSGLVWIGTESGGVDRWNPRSWDLGGHRPDWLVGKFVAAFADAPDNRVWISSLGGGLVQFDPDSGRKIDLDTVLHRKIVFDGGRVMSLHEDRGGTLWIGTMASGLERLDADGRLRSIGAKAGDPHSLSAAGVMTIFESRSGQLWIGTYNGGVNVLDPATGLIRQLPHGTAPGAVSGDNIPAIAEDSRGNIWIGTERGGLDLARADGTVIKAFRHAANDPASLPANTVYALAVDAHGNVWVGTDGGGLAQVLGSPDAPQSIRFRVLSRDQGLSNDTIYGVLPDASGRIWLSSDSGLMRLDPETGIVKTFHRVDGLQGEEFDTGAYYRLRDGRLAFGGPGGFNIFDPTRLTDDGPPPRLALTRVEVLGVPAPGPTPYWLRSRITLDYRASIVSLDVAVLDFRSPKHNRLAYRMAGLTDRWIDLGNQQRITLTNLDSGDHVLEVRGASSDSVWTPVPLKITLHRDPAPWRSAWAYVLYVLVALGLIAQRLYRQRLKFRRIVEEQQRLEREVQARTRELTESNRQLAEAARAKSSFLDRISHELRTPMNGVVGMTELLALTTLSATQGRLTRTIRTSAQVMLRIVNDLLDLSRIRAGKVELEELPLDLGQILEECTALFAGAAAAKGVELIVCPPPRIERTLLGDPLRLRQILMNLVGNAVKFTAHGEVVVKADVELGSDRPRAQLCVTDTGIGMDAATIAKVFEPFTQADESTTRRFGGSGLGLAICRELAELMGGTITVESRPQVGSTFRLTLPLEPGAEATRPEPRALAARTVRIVTRRPALAESLERYALLLGLEVRNDAPTSDGGAVREDIIIIDAGTHPEELARALKRQPGSPAQPAVVVVASAAECGREELCRLPPAVSIVQKPVQREALLEALSSALGIPLARVPDADTSPAVPSLGAHVLLVEDEPVNAAVAQGYLATLGCTSVWVKDGTEAITRHRTERFDLILMDLNMPNLDGFATARLIRQRSTGERVPIVALTANDGVDRRESCFAAGMDDMLSKPATLEDCARVLRRWIRRKPPVQAVPEAAAAFESEGPGRETLSTVDLKTVASLRNLRGSGQMDLYSKLVDLFRTGSADALARLGEVLESGDLHAAAAVCHKLKSSASNVGAITFAKSVRELEQLCRAGDLARARELHRALRDAHPMLLEELADLKLRASA